MKPPFSPRTATQDPVQAPPFVERRRPGRPEHVSPELIPLLRGQAVVSDQLADAKPKRLATNSASTGERALWAAWLLSILLWAFVAFGGWSWLFS